MGLLSRSRTQQTLGGVLGGRERMGQYQLADMAQRAQVAQTAVSQTVSQMDKKKGSETEEKPSGLAYATLGASILGTGAKVYQGMQETSKDRLAYLKKAKADGTITGEELSELKGLSNPEVVGKQTEDVALNERNTAGTGKVVSQEKTTDIEALAKENNQALQAGTTEVASTEASGVDATIDGAVNQEILQEAAAGGKGLVADSVSNLASLDSAVQNLEAIGTATETAETASSGFEFLSMFT